MRLLISGYYGFGNAGDEAVLAAIIDGLFARLPGAEVCVLSATPHDTAQAHGVQAAQRWSSREVWRALGEADLLIQGGGGLLQDATSKASALYYLAILRLARLRRVPSMVFAQGIGPLRTPALRRLTRREFARVSAITVRDEGSMAELREMGLASPTPVLAADPALLLSPDIEAARESLAKLDIDPNAPALVITLRAWPGVERIAAACAKLATQAIERHGLQVLLLPFQPPADTEVLRGVVEAEPRCRLLPGEGDVRELLGHVARARLVVAMRLHGIIFAAAQAVPAIGIAYDPKLNAFAARAGQQVLGLEECSAEALIAAADEALSGASGRAPEREATARDLQAAAELSLDVLQELVGGT